MVARQLAAQTVPTSGGNVTTTDKFGDGNHYTASDHGLLSWSLDPAACSSGGTSLVVGYIYLTQVILRTAATISKVCVTVGTAGATLTSGQCLAALYTSAGTRVGLTADQSTAWTSVGYKAISLTASYSAAAGKYYCALLVNGTTSPTFACGSTYGATFTPGNSGLAASNYRFCRSPANGNTSLGTSLTLSGYTPDANNLWVAVA
ncbi:hypothetical protein [Streptomyces sp. NPDC001089]